MHRTYQTIEPLSDFQTPNQSVGLSDSDCHTSIGLSTSIAPLWDFRTPGSSVGLKDSATRTSTRLSDSRPECWPIELGLSDLYQTFGLTGKV